MGLITETRIEIFVSHFLSRKISIHFFITSIDCSLRTIALYMHDSRHKKRAVFYALLQTHCTSCSPSRSSWRELFSPTSIGFASSRKSYRESQMAAHSDFKKSVSGPKRPSMYRMYRFTTWTSKLRSLLSTVRGKEAEGLRQSTIESYSRRQWSFPREAISRCKRQVYIHLGIAYNKGLQYWLT